MTNVAAGHPGSPAPQLFMPAGWKGPGQPPLYTADQIAALVSTAAQPAAVAGLSDAQIIAAFRAYHGWLNEPLTSGAEAARWKHALTAALAAAPKAAPAAVAVPSEPPLIGRWHHGNGVLVSGSVRIARSDFDTDPPDDFRDEVLEWMCTTLNAALSAPQPPAAAQEPVAWLHTNKHVGVQAFTNEPPPGLKAQCQPLYTHPAPQQAAPVAMGDAMPTIKGASIGGGYVIVTPAGWGDDKAWAVRDAILRIFPVNPAYTPKPDESAARTQAKEGGA